MVVRALRAVLALFVLSLGLVLTTAVPASACTCTIQSFEKQVQRAEVVFIATVDEVTEDAEGGYTYSVTASRSYTGDVERSTQVQSRAGTCGLGELKVGKDYLFLASGPAAPYDSSICDGTISATPERVGKLENVLDSDGEVVAPPPPPEATMKRVEDSPPLGFARMAAPGVAAVLLGALGLFVVRRLARR